MNSPIAKKSPTCPFRIGGGTVSLVELGSVVRLGNARRFSEALQQLEESLYATSADLDEARSLALTFVAVVSAALLETGAPRNTHRLQLEVARKLDKLQDPEEIVSYTLETARALTTEVMTRAATSSSYLVDRALTLIDRNYARQLSDMQLASQLGLSKSHFRFLFKQATRLPFNQYLVALRLEKARQLLIRDHSPICEIADQVGFGSPAHFSRAFAKRFSMSPSVLRHASRPD